MTINWGQLITAEDKAVEALTVLKKFAGVTRYQHEVKGITVLGMAVDTGRDSQGLIAGAALAAVIDSNYSVNWKTQAGFVQLNATQIIGLATAVRAHVQACFDRENEILTAIDEGTFTEAMLTEGWPV